MSYHSTGYFGTADQVQAINQSLEASAAASPEQLYPPLQPVRFKENNMYTSVGSTNALLSANISTKTKQNMIAYNESVVTLPIIGAVKKTHLYVGLAAVAGLVILKKMKKI